MEQLTNFIERTQGSRITFWLGAIAGFLLILIVGAGLRKILKRNIKEHKAHLFVDSIINWITLFILVVYFFTYFSKSSFIYQTLFVLGDTQVTVFLLLTIVFSVILAVKLSQAIQNFILPVIFDRHDFDLGLRASISTFTNYFIITMAVLISLSSIGFDLSSLTVFASVLGVGLGFGLKNVMSNFISGLIILFERPITVGDRVIIDGTIADVEEIKIRATVVRTRINERMIIPNSYFLEEKIVNRSYEDQRLRMKVEVDVAYGSDVKLVKRLLMDSVYELKEESWPEIVHSPKPRVFFDDFADSGLHFSVWFWINSQKNEREFRIPSDLRFKIIEKFEENNVAIPFPQQDIHIIEEDE